MLTVLFGVCTIGGGHVYRDLAIGAELQRLVPQVEVVYLSAGPSAEMLRSEKVKVEEALMPAPYSIREGRLDALRTVYGTSFAEFVGGVRILPLLRKYRPKLVIMDEVGIPGLVARQFGCRFAYLANFVFWPEPEFWRDPLTSLTVRTLVNPIFRKLVHRADVSLFLGTPSHVPRAVWRKWASEHVTFIGPIGREKLQVYPARNEARAQLRLVGKTVITVTVGAGHAGKFLLQAVVRALPELRAALPDLSIVLVCGPSIDPSEIAQPVPGLEVLGYSDQLLSFLAASDLAIVQAGLATVTDCMKLAVPMLVFPLENHWEQQYVAEYAEAAGHAIVLSREAIRGGRLAQAVVRVCADEELRRQMSVRIESPHEGDAARKAAQWLAPLLQPRLQRTRDVRRTWPPEWREVGDALPG